MTLSGLYFSRCVKRWPSHVLIPLLLDGPLWVVLKDMTHCYLTSLNPSFAGWPSLGNLKELVRIYLKRLNPSFAGWPSLGILKQFQSIIMIGLNPSFAGWPSLGGVFEDLHYDLCMS